MGVFEDYISGLDGQENLDPVEVARNLHELHNSEIGTREAKIEELNGSIAERDGALSARDSEIQKWKAHNFDLAMQIPSAVEKPPVEPTNDNGDITIDDLFVKGNN
jgi:hypothetical protein